MKLRPATIDDAQLLFDWRNEPLTRAMSVNTEPVAWDDHVKWLSIRLARPEPGLYICEDGIPCGMVRIDNDEISYTVDMDFRGKGLATKMLILARHQFGSKRAKVKRSNEASAKAATKAGHTVEYI
ncbi:MAG TPA: GNAT family N-acetyltransferase [Mesorhizobium sp.]|jgi:RimJ/RimL family protein N-acetyltransferase|uniref:GNAT family N-acetyltransferase n=1 Tax=Mesorhizobium sp. TaxID=1871066 RepID=UPI002DDD705F|nr:GNAT family N-acetyltransferase [Mesorhizobium sp.]HEV2503141.1 GNAT family N-acetyltransferase [Mesorhizobium sp.]